MAERIKWGGVGEGSPARFYILEAVPLLQRQADARGVLSRLRRPMTFSTVRACQRQRMALVFAACDDLFVRPGLAVASTILLSRPVCAGVGSAEPELSCAPPVFGASKAICHAFYAARR